MGGLPYVKTTVIPNEIVEEILEVVICELWGGESAGMLPFGNA